MKKTYLFITLVFILFSTSCDKYLEVDSLSVNDLGYIFSNKEQARTFITSIYQPWSQETNRLLFYANFNTDVEMGKIGPNYDNGRRDLWAYDVKSTNSYMINAWRACYSGADRANNAIKGIKESDFYNDGDPDIMHMLGEAYTLRAYWYSQLVRHWGDIPFKVTPWDAGDDFYLAGTDRDLILSQLIDDLIEVEPYMKWAPELPYGVHMASRSYAQALIARIALARGGYSLRPARDGRAEIAMVRNDDYREYYQIANTYCKKLIESGMHSLNLPYRTVFLNQNYGILVSNDDMIFEVAYRPGVGEVGYIMGLKVSTGNHDYGKGGGVFMLVPSYVYSFDTLDTRLPATAAFYSYNDNLYQQITSVTDIQIAKWCKAWLPTPPGRYSVQGDGINWPLMRYADVLLMYAETENELNNGPTEAAKDALRQVRQRAFTPEHWAEKVDGYINAVSGSKETFFEAIVNERAWELGGELVRKADLVRWNLLGKKISETRTTMTQMGRDTRDGSGKFANFPDRIYHKTDSLTKTIEIVGQFSRLPGTPEGYTARNWLLGLVDNEGNPIEIINTNWRGYQDPTGLAPVKYIFPIPESAIIQSNGSLSNDGYGFPGG